jgi:acyl-homoserine-lactone acylase
MVGGRLTPLSGTSYVQLVEFGGPGTVTSPVARGLLNYSQSTDPRSPYFGNQIDAFSRMELMPLAAVGRE